MRYGRLVVTGLLLLSSASIPFTALAQSQSLPHLRTTFVPRLLPEPNACYQLACFDRASYDANTLAAIGTLEPAVHVFLRISAGPWYAQSIRRNTSPLPIGYDVAGYRYPLAVVGDDILVTAFRTGPGVPELCETHVWGRTDTRWRVKQVINVCAEQFAKDGNRVLFGASVDMPIYARDANGLFAEESRVPVPSDGTFDGEKSLAFHAWSVVVGKPNDASTGLAYVFQRRAGEWTLAATLRPEASSSNTRFGHAVGVYEYNIAVAAPGAINPSIVGLGLVHLYTGVGDRWFVSQEIGEPPPGAIEYPVGNTFGTALALRGRRLIVSTTNPFQGGLGPPSYLFERGVRESSWAARATLAGDGLSIDVSGNTAMIDRRGQRAGTAPTVVNLPALRELEFAL